MTSSKGHFAYKLIYAYPRTLIWFYNVGKSAQERISNSYCARWCLSTSAYIGCEKTVTGVMGLRMRRVNRLDRAWAVFYRQLSDISVAVRH